MESTIQFDIPYFETKSTELEKLELRVTVALSFNHGCWIFLSSTVFLPNQGIRIYIACIIHIWTTTIQLGGYPCFHSVFQYYDLVYHNMYKLPYFLCLFFGNYYQYLTFFHNLLSLQLHWLTFHQVVIVFSAPVST